MNRIASLCVYCGASIGRLDTYAKAARALAATLVARGIRLVYGGGSVGIMGAVADEVLRLGGQVVGIIPEALVRKELVHRGLTELHVTPSMHARKMRMAELSDGFVALPGGIGTLEELFEIWTWAQLGFHRKPCGLLNVDGYYDALIHFLDHATAEQFVRPHQRSMLMVSTDPDALLDEIARYEAPPAPPWIRDSET